MKQQKRKERKRRKKLEKTLTHIFNKPTDYQKIKTLAHYKWLIENTRDEDVKYVLRFIDGHSWLFPLTNRLYNMLSQQMKFNNICLALHNLELFQLCVDVGFNNVIHYEPYNTLKAGVLVENHMIREWYQQYLVPNKKTLCLYWYIKNYIITV
jgi:hypothetical protein